MILAHDHLVPCGFQILHYKHIRKIPGKCGFVECTSRMAVLLILPGTPGILLPKTSFTIECYF